KLAFEEKPPRSLTDLVQGSLAGLELTHPRGELFCNAVCLHVLPVSFGGGGESIGNAHPFGGKLLHHLPERGILAADAAHVLLVQRLEPGDEWRRRRQCVHTCPPDVLVDDGPIIENSLNG